MSGQLFSITNKLILITGSARGIGFILAKGMGLEGAKVIINDINLGNIEKALSELFSLGIKAYGYQFDITNESQVIDGIESIRKDLGEIDVLINNAGIQIRHPAEEFPIEDYEKILSVNLKGAFIVSKVVGQSMIKKCSGKIINICSMQSELGRNSITPYAASKGGLKMMTKGFATEWGKYNIQVNGIGPGYFITDMTKSLVEDKIFNAWLCNRTPANRWGDPKELIGTAIFLSSEASGYINGQIIYVDGGMLACV